MDLLALPLIQDAAIYLSAVVLACSILAPLLRAAARGVESIALATITAKDDKPAGDLSGGLMWLADVLDSLGGLIGRLAIPLPRRTPPPSRK